MNPLSAAHSPLLFSPHFLGGPEADSADAGTHLGLHPCWTCSGFGSFSPEAAIAITWEHSYFILLPNSITGGAAVSPFFSCVEGGNFL